MDCYSTTLSDRLNSGRWWPTCVVGMEQELDRRSLVKNSARGAATTAAVISAPGLMRASVAPIYASAQSQRITESFAVVSLPPVGGSSGETLTLQTRVIADGGARATFELEYPESSAGLPDELLVEGVLTGGESIRGQFPANMGGIVSGEFQVESGVAVGLAALATTVSGIRLEFPVIDAGLIDL